MWQKKSFLTEVDESFLNEHFEEDVDEYEFMLISSSFSIEENDEAECNEISFVFY